MSDTVISSILNVSTFAAFFVAGWMCRTELARWRIERSLEQAEKRLAARGIYPPDEHGRKP